jgi:hypothetical protein
MIPRFSSWLRLIIRPTASPSPASFIFQHPILERQLGYRLLQLIDLTPHLHHFLAVGLMLGISDQALIPCFQKFFTLLVV